MYWVAHGALRQLVQENCEALLEDLDLFGNLGKGRIERRVEGSAMQV